jgi:S1-C subfamily serine protease
MIVKSVVRNGPIERAGIVVGDVILRVNRLLLRSGEDLGLMLETVEPGQRVLLEGLDARTGDAWWALVGTRTQS